MAKHWIATSYTGIDGLEFVDYDVPAPGVGEVTLTVRAAGMNPADWKHVAPGSPASEELPVAIGYEAAGVISAIGPNTEIASGGGAVGDEVMTFRIHGGYADSITVPAADVFAKPATLDFPAAANLFLAGLTAAEMLHVTGVGERDTIVVHGASGAVGVSILQQARLLGARAIGTASKSNFEIITRFGGVPVEYGEGLENRLRALAPEGYAAALGCVGTDESIDASLALVKDRDRIVEIANFSRAPKEGIKLISGAMPASAAYRAQNRARLVGLAADGHLVVPMAKTFPLASAQDALRVLADQHPGGKLALIP